MIIDRKTILAVILADFFVMFGAVFIMWDRIQLAQARMPVAMAMPMPAPIPTPAVKPEIPQPAPVENQSPAANPTDSAPLTAIPDNTNTTALSSPEETSASAPSRRIRFSYRNSKPRKVEIIGDFNKWQPQPLTRGKNFEWYATFPLRPGEYTYNFIVDGRVIRDPNNPRTASEGRSLLTVKPLTE